jgi:ABC-type nitrate/sulfonate/bicarbonate transport system substrate-binding protein
MSMQRKPLVVRINFADSTTGVAEAGAGREVGGQIDVSQLAFGGLHVSSGLNGRTVSFVDNGPWGAHTVLSKALATGFVTFDSDELIRLGSSMQLTATLDLAATGDLWLKMKS